MLFCSLLAHQLTMFLVQIHNISALLLVYITKMGSFYYFWIITLRRSLKVGIKLNRPRKKKKIKKNRYLAYWYSGTCSFKMTGQGSWNKPTSSKSSEKIHFRPHDLMYIPNWQLRGFLRKFGWRLKPLFRITMA